MTDRITDQQLAEIDARANAATPGPWRQSEDYNDIHSADGDHLASYWHTTDGEFIEAAREDVPALLAEVRRLRAENVSLDRALGDTIDDRDQAQEIADKLAYAVAPIEVLGEHTSMNCPWTNALELITSKADVDKLRARVAEMQPDADLLEALRAYGVDNWDGYDEAIQAAESASS